MDMVGHEYPSMNRNAIPIRTFKQAVREERHIPITGETDLPVITALHDMHGQSWRTITPSPWHQNSP
jgi:hypothetical protein